MGKNETGSQRNIWREYPPLEGQEENQYDRFKKRIQIPLKETGHSKVLIPTGGLKVAHSCL